MSINLKTSDPFERGLMRSCLLVLMVALFQDLGAYVLSAIIDGQRIPEPDVLAMTQGIAIFVGLPLSAIPALAGSLRAQKSASTQAWAQYIVPASYVLSWGLFSGLVAPSFGGPEELRVILLTAPHLAVTVVLGLYLSFQTRLFGFGPKARSEAVRPTQPLASLQNLRARLEQKDLPEAFLSIAQELLAELNEAAEAETRALAQSSSALKRLDKLSSEASSDQVEQALSQERSAHNERRLAAELHLAEISVAAERAVRELDEPSSSTQAKDKLKNEIKRLAGARAELKR